MKEVIRGFKRGLVWCTIILSGIITVTIIKVIIEAYQHIYDPPKGSMF